MSRDKLAMWTVYNSPSDYPGKFVARLFEVDGEGPVVTPSILIADDLETLRVVLEVEMGLIRIRRADDDEPQIVETWL